MPMIRLSQRISTRYPVSGRKERGILTLSEQLQAFIQERIAAINAGASGWVSEDGSALMVDGGPLVDLSENG